MLYFQRLGGWWSFSANPFGLRGTGVCSERPCHLATEVALGGGGGVSRKRPFSSMQLAESLPATHSLPPTLLSMSRQGHWGRGEGGILKLIVCSQQLLYGRLGEADPTEGSLMKALS